MLRAAIIGMGRWGQVLVDAVQGRSAELRFVAGVAGPSGRGRELADRQGIEILPDLDAVLARPDVQAVVLATPHSLHGAQIAAAAAAGKHVLCEKPLTLTRAEAEAAFAAAAAGGVVLAVAQNRRFLPAYTALRDLVQTGRIGTIRQIVGNHSWSGAAYPAGSWRRDPRESPAGGMAGLGIHSVDAICGLGLRASAVSVVTRGSPEAPDHTVTALLSLASGALGVVTTIAGPGRFWRLEVFGDAGWAAMDGVDRLVFSAGGGPVETIRFDPVDIERAELEAFAAVLRGQGAWPVSRDEAIAGIAVFEAIAIGAAASGGWTRVPA